MVASFTGKLNSLSLSVCDEANDEVWTSLGGLFHQKFLFRAAKGWMIRSFSLCEIYPYFCSNSTLFGGCWLAGGGDSDGDGMLQQIFSLPLDPR